MKTHFCVRVVSELGEEVYISNVDKQRNIFFVVKYRQFCCTWPTKRELENDLIGVDRQRCTFYIEEF